MENLSKKDSWFAKAGTIGFFSLSIVLGLLLLGTGIGLFYGRADAGATAGLGAGLFAWGLVISLKNWRNL